MNIGVEIEQVPGLQWLVFRIFETCGAALNQPLHLTEQHPNLEKNQTTAWRCRQNYSTLKRILKKALISFFKRFFYGSYMNMIFQTFLIHPENTKFQFL